MKKLSQLPATDELCIFTDTEVIEWPGVIIILSKCIEHQKPGKNKVTPGCGGKTMGWRQKEKPLSHLHYGDVEEILKGES